MVRFPMNLIMGVRSAAAEARRILVANILEVDLERNAGRRSWRWFPGFCWGNFEVVFFAVRGVDVVCKVGVEALFKTQDAPG